MKNLVLLLGFALLHFHADAQQKNKYAIIFSRAAVVSGTEKIVARNNIKVIKEGLELQGVKSSNIRVDSGSSKSSLMEQLRELEQKVYRDDFVFLYFDFPFAIEDHPEKTLKLVIDPGKPGQFILAPELQNLLTRISYKVNDPSIFTVAFDADGLSLAELAAAKKFSIPDKMFMNYFFACSTGEKRSFHNQTSVFALGFNHALSSISSFNITYRGFFNNLKKNVLMYTASQRPQLVGNAQDMVLFNGCYVMYPVHFKILEQPDPNTVIINAGERLNIFPGAKTKFFDAYADTLSSYFVVEGTIISATDYTATVKLSAPSKVNRDLVWAYVGENLNDYIYKVRFNQVFESDALSSSVFKRILNGLKSPGMAKYVEFVNKGGDIQVANIQESAEGITATLINPVSGFVLKNVRIDKENLYELESFIRSISKYEKLFRVTNDIAEISLLVDMIYQDTSIKIQVENGFPVLYSSDKIKVKLTNSNNIPVYYSLIDLQPDKLTNIIYPNNSMPPNECVVKASETLELELSVAPPFGMERFKIITSLEPVHPENFAGESYTRGASAGSRFENLNIQDYDFEIRDRLFYSRAGGVQSTPITTSVSSVLYQQEGKKKLSVENRSSDRVYVNLIRSDENGNYTLLFPVAGQSDANFFIEKNGSKSFDVVGNLKEMDQLITVYADRPFTLAKFTREDRQMSDLVLEIIRNGKISGSPLNKITLSQQLFTPKSDVVMRDGDQVMIKLVTPKLTTDRNLALRVKSIQYDINGFAIGAGNKPVKALRINGEEVKYDKTLLFFDQTIKLVAGKNRVVIEAEDDKGFKEYKNIDIELENTQVVASGAGKNHFLGIAIDNYKTWPRLYNAKNDVNSVAELLGKKYGFEKANMKFLLDAAATRKNIIDSIRGFLSKAGPNDNVIIYLSGHGNEDQLADGEYYFIPQDADAEDVTSAVSSADVLLNFKKIRAKHCILIVDACYSGMITNNAGTDQRVTTTDEVIPLDQLPSKWIITSGRGTKVADGTNGNSPFTSVLLNYLREKSEPADLRITTVINYLVDNVGKLNPKQLPLGVSIQGQGVPVFKVANTGGK